MTETFITTEDFSVMIYEMVSRSVYYICLILLLSKISSIFASRPYRAAAVRGKPTQAKAWG